MSTITIQRLRKHVPVNTGIDLFALPFSQIQQETQETLISVYPKEKPI